MRLRNTCKGLAVLALGLVVQACSEEGITAPADSAAAGTPALVVTTTKTPPPDLVVKTAEPYWRQNTTYDWALAKTVTPSNLTLGQGQTGLFNYTITANRTGASTTTVYGMTGTMCVTNGADEPGRITSLVDEFYSYDGSVLTLVKQMDVDFSSDPLLEGGETNCFPYDLEMDAGFVPNPELIYANRVKAVGETVAGGASASSYSDYVVVVWPSEPTESEVIDESATVTDVVDCPVGFTCTPAGAQWTFGSSASQAFQVTVTNVSAPCGDSFEVVNGATLTESDSGEQHQASATSTVASPACEPPPLTPAGCTPGFWQGGNGGKLWNTANDPQWKGNGVQPFTQATLFNSFFTSHPALNGLTMIDLVGTGGGPIPARKAARDLVAAYLNTTYWGGYPWSQAELAAKWTAAVAGGDAALMALHTELDAANNRCSK